MPLLDTHVGHDIENDGELYCDTVMLKLIEEKSRPLTPVPGRTTKTSVSYQTILGRLSTAGTTVSSPTSESKTFGQIVAQLKS